MNSQEELVRVTINEEELRRKFAEEINKAAYANNDNISNSENEDTNNIAFAWRGLTDAWHDFRKSRN